MKIIVNQVPAEGLYLKEKVKSAELDLETELIKFRPEVIVEAQVQRISGEKSLSLKVVRTEEMAVAEGTLFW